MTSAQVAEVQVYSRGVTRVLIADDDNVVRDVVRRYLERDGLDVSIAHNGSEALRLLGSQRIDVAVLDVMMPGPDGLTLCRTLRQRGGYGMPVILLTALGGRTTASPDSRPAPTTT
jgi:DNA-binding response OmpR family regulator